MSTRLSAVGHGDLLLWNPLPEAETLAFVDALEVAPGARILDVGCGRAELLIRLVARTGARGVGVDPWPHAIATARAAAAGRVDPSRIEFREERFDAARFPDASIDVALCVGATHAFGGGLVEVLRTFRRLLVPGGVAVIGEGHWLREPEPGYLAFLGAKRDELLDHAGNLARARTEGLHVVTSRVSSREDFDRYEDRYEANLERFVAEHADDPDADAFRARIRAWRAARVTWGHRDTMGFALYVLRRAQR